MNKTSIEQYKSKHRKELDKPQQHTGTHLHNHTQHYDSDDDILHKPEIISPDSTTSVENISFKAIFRTLRKKQRGEKLTQEEEQFLLSLADPEMQKLLHKKVKNKFVLFQVIICVIIFSVFFNMFFT